MPKIPEPRTNLDSSQDDVVNVDFFSLIGGSSVCEFEVQKPSNRRVSSGHCDCTPGHKSPSRGADGATCKSTSWRTSNCNISRSHMGPTACRPFCLERQLVLGSWTEGHSLYKTLREISICTSYS
jgi:hypothetical protein